MPGCKGIRNDLDQTGSTFGSLLIAFGVVLVFLGTSDGVFFPVSSRNIFVSLMSLEKSSDRPLRHGCAPRTDIQNTTQHVDHVQSKYFHEIFPRSVSAKATQFRYVPFVMCLSCPVFSLP